MSRQKRPPVVTIIGHVDHGKTTLLDYVHKTKLAAKEYGEITQAIGAYQAEFNGQKITFIDTPGHEAFTQMRSRGARAADIVVLVVAANDGVMPQTKECLRVLKESNTPFIVAINKIDLPGASVDKVKGQLAENGVLVEGYGGKTVAVPISAKTGQGVDQLLEMLLLTAEMAELSADPAGCFLAEVIESKTDKFSGVAVSLVIKEGTLRKGDVLVLDGQVAKVKQIRDNRHRQLPGAGPADPVVVLGFSQLPPVGGLVYKQDEVIAGRVCPVPTTVAASDSRPEGKLKIILKTDVTGSLEAILGCLPEEVTVMEKGVGEINESDILLAKTLGVPIYGFNLSLSSQATKLAETEKVKVKTYRIIYDLLQDIERKILKILEPTIDRQVLGRAEVMAIFEIKGEKIIGCRVNEGKINKNSLVCLERDKRIVLETRVKTLRQGKQEVNEAAKGEEFGAVLAKELDFQAGDVLISYNLEEN